MRRYPAPISLTALAYAIGAIFLVISGLFFVEKRSDWVITETTALIAVGYAVCTLADLPTTPPKKSCYSFLFKILQFNFIVTK